MEPEISHRCMTCGASARVGKHFCHQCGAVIDKPAQTQIVSPEVPEVAKVARTERSLPAQPPAFNSEVRELPFPVIKSDVDKSPNPQDTMPSVFVSVGSSVRSQTKRQRVADAARDMVAGNVLPRVEKIRQVSSVVLEEASAIDPSLRFVLIAVVLFLVFVALLLFSFIK